MALTRVILLFIVALVLVALVVANREPTRLDLVFKQVDVPLFAVILVSWGFGVLSYAVFALVGEIRLRSRLAQQRRENEALMQELNDLRNLPLAGDETPGAAEGKRREES